MVKVNSTASFSRCLSLRFFGSIIRNHRRTDGSDGLARVSSRSTYSTLMPVSSRKKSIHSNSFIVGRFSLFAEIQRPMISLSAGSSTRAKLAGGIPDVTFL